MKVVNETENTLGKRIRSLTKMNGYTRLTLAREIDITKDMVSKYMNNAREPRLATIVKLANVFSVSTDYLLGVENNQMATDNKKEQKILEISISQLKAFIETLDDNKILEVYLIDPDAGTETDRRA